MVRIGLVVALVIAGAIAGSTLSFAPAYLAIPVRVAERDRETLAP